MRYIFHVIKISILDCYVAPQKKKKSFSPLFHKNVGFLWLCSETKQWRSCKSHRVSSKLDCSSKATKPNFLVNLKTVQQMKLFFKTKWFLLLHIEMNPALIGVDFNFSFDYFRWRKKSILNQKILNIIFEILWWVWCSIIHY